MFNTKGDKHLMMYLSQYFFSLSFSYFFQFFSFIFPNEPIDPPVLGKEVLPLMPPTCVTW